MVKKVNLVNKHEFSLFNFVKNLKLFAQTYIRVSVTFRNCEEKKVEMFLGEKLVK